ncbi:MAG TPA: L-histidine N(alpha)-methyltransferase [Candidatus Saccharimonadales bacterium]|nr:L-histidine N(alpha)-methyltransferase [Candidatus Saccharimonadales bacterium]
MLYFKNPELAETYHVSLRTVLNWVEAAKQGKLDLELYETNDRSYITNTARNVSAIERLVTDRRKYRNTRGLRVIRPKPEIYDIFDRQQLFDIIADLDIHHEIQRQYNYFDGGAEYWDEYANRLGTEQHLNGVTFSIKLLDSCQAYLNDLTSRYKHVNVIEIGPGNALPVKKFLENLLLQGRLGRYVALDISPAMIDIARRNFQSWFGTRIRFESREADINYDRFADMLAEEYVRSRGQDTINLVLLLGGTLENFRSPDDALRVIQNSMGTHDVLIRTMKLDTTSGRRLFQFNVFNNPGGGSSFSPNHRFVFDLLNLDKSLYEIETGFDEQKRQRYLRARLNVAVSIVFDFKEGSRQVDLHKGDTVLLWRYWHQDAFATIKQLDRNGFSLLYASLTPEQDFMLSVSRIKLGD